MTSYFLPPSSSILFRLYVVLLSIGALLPPCPVLPLVGAQLLLCLVLPLVGTQLLLFPALFLASAHLLPFHPLPSSCSFLLLAFSFSLLSVASFVCPPLPLLFLRPLV